MVADKTYRGITMLDEAGKKTGTQNKTYKTFELKSQTECWGT